MAYQGPSRLGGAATGATEIEGIEENVSTGDGVTAEGVAKSAKSVRI